MSARPRSGELPERFVHLQRMRLRAWLVRLAGPGQPLWARIDAFNGLLAGAALVAALATLVWFGQPIALPEVAVAEAPAAAVPATASSETIDAAVPVSARSSLDLGGGRLFVPSKVAARTRGPRANVTLSELSRSLKLLGVLGGDRAQAIISNEATGQVLYLSAGEFVGEIRVEEVRESTVLLAWKDQTMELVL